MRYYISIEKNIEGFEFFKGLWVALGVIGIRADSMAEGIEKAIEIEKSKADELYFIDIVADDIDYMPQLQILHEETDAPILIATSAYDDDEREKALNIGADFYGKYCETPEQNINAVIAVVNSIDRRAAKKRPPSQVMIYKGLLVDPHRYQHGVFVGDKKIEQLTRQDFDILYYLMKNRGKVLTYRQIYRRVWGSDYEDAERDVLWAAVKRLREKLKSAPDSSDYIKAVPGVGYSFSLDFDK